MATDTEKDKETARILTGPEMEVEQVLADWFDREPVTRAFPSDTGARPGDGTPGPGKPRSIEVEVRLVYMLASVGTSIAEIARIAGCHPETIRYHYGELIETAKANLRSRLRAAQVRVAIQEGNPTMLIWLGKNLLGQYDESRLRISDMRSMSDEDIELLAQGKMPKALMSGDDNTRGAVAPLGEVEADYEIIERKKEA